MGSAACALAHRVIGRCIVPVTITIAVVAASLAHARGLEDLEKCRQAIAARATDIARSMCARALKDPSLPPKARAEAHFNRGWVAREDSEALADYNAAIALDPGFGWAYLARGYVLQDRGQYEKALADLTMATKLVPDEAMAWYRHGQLLLKMGRPADAARDFERLSVISPQWSTAWNRRGAAEAVMGRNDRALAYLGHSLRLQPTNAGSLEMRATLHAEQGDWRAARADADAAVRIDPAAPTHRLTRGRIAMLSGNNAQAIDDMRNAIPDLDDPTRRVFGAIWMSMAVLRSGRQIEFAPVILNFVAKDKDRWPSPVAWAYLATLGKANPRWNFGRIEDHLARAQQAAKDLSSGAPENRACEYGHLLGTYHVLTGDPARGRPLLSQAARQRLFSWCYIGARAELARLDQPRTQGTLR
jgi:tetratricopeptide (TPR) repeat protein